jgi:hypothetical protein
MLEKAIDNALSLLGRKSITFFFEMAGNLYFFKFRYLSLNSTFLEPISNANMFSDEILSEIVKPFIAYANGNDMSRILNGDVDTYSISLFRCITKKPMHKNKRITFKTQRKLGTLLRLNFEGMERSAIEKGVFNESFPQTPLINTILNSIVVNSAKKNYKIQFGFLVIFGFGVKFFQKKAIFMQKKCVILEHFSM